MNFLALTCFLSVFCLMGYEKEAISKSKIQSKPTEKESFTDQSPSLNNQGNHLKKTSSEAGSEAEKAQKITSKIKKSQLKELEKDSARQESKMSDIVSQKIKKVFVEFLEILERKSIDSKEYIKAVHFLENSLYNEASFETLKILAETYKNKKDFPNQIKVLNILSVSYPEKAESFYLLGSAYSHLFFHQKEDKEENKTKSIENLNKALKKDKKFVLAYEGLIKILKSKKEDTDQDIHTKESLSVIIDMLKNLKNHKHYIDLCKAYYDNKFFKQSRKACKKSIAKNPENPISPLILALSLKDKKESEKAILDVSEKFKESFFVQYNTALYFMKKNPRLAIIYFDSAHALQPDNVTLNKIMSLFLFENDQEDKSYKHFLKACLLTKGKFIREFRKAKSRLRKKALVDLILKFQKGIDQCFLSSKKKINKKEG